MMRAKRHKTFPDQIETKVSNTLSMYLIMKSTSRMVYCHAGGLGKTTVLLLLFVLCSDTTYAQGNSSRNVATPPQRVEIPNTQLLKITSAMVAQEYDLYIPLPRGYGSSKDSYPVVYLLDAQWDFPLVTAIFGQQFYDGVSGFQKFADHLKARNYQGLSLQTRVLENTGHSGTKAEGYTRGLQAVFARPSLNLAPAILAQYVGAYQLNPEVKINVAMENDHLVAQGPDNMRFVLHTETETGRFTRERS